MCIFFLHTLNIQRILPFTHAFHQLRSFFPLSCISVEIFIKNKPLTITSTFFCLIHVSFFSLWPTVYAKSKKPCNTVVSLSTHSILSLSAIFNFFVASDHYLNAVSFSQRKYFKIPMENTRQRPKKLMFSSIMTFSVKKKNLFGSQYLGL